MTHFRYFLAAVALLALAYGPPAFARAIPLDDPITSQQSTALRSVDDAPRFSQWSPVFITPAYADTLSAPAESGSSGLAYLVDLAFAALAVVAALFVPRVWLAIFKTAPTANDTAAILKIIDNGFDFADAFVKGRLPASATPIDFHNATLNAVENFVLTFATPAQMKSIGITAENLRLWLTAELQPSTAGTPVPPLAAAAVAPVK